jgi:hypothetical protein
MEALVRRAARELRDLIEPLDEAAATLDLLHFGFDFGANPNVAEISRSERDFIRNAIAAAVDFISGLNEREIEGRGSP